MVDLHFKSDLSAQEGRNNEISKQKKYILIQKINTRCLIVHLQYTAIPDYNN